MDYETLIVKNIPKNIKLAEFFKKNYNAIAARYYGRARAVVRFENEDDAKIALIKLHQHEIDNHILSVEYLGKRELIRRNENTLAKESTSCEEYVPNFAKKLLAISSAHGFHHLPPPHLKYSYPKINRDILDAISIALLSNSKFYVQVLHLMNRMNLDPPFLERRNSFVPPGDLKNAQTQTNFEKLDRLLDTDESEIESSDEKQPRKKRSKIDKNEYDNEKLRKRLKQVLKSQTLVKSTAQSSTRELEKNDYVFESSDASNFTKKIIMNVASVKLPEDTLHLIAENSNDHTQIVEKQHEKITDVTNIKSKETVTEKELSFADLEENRIPESQLKDMNIYKNYQRGEQSNKLYIKNLTKNVTVEDLKKIYKIFVKDVETELEIKLMQYGRMKGQAFISFLKLDENDFNIVLKALDLTNGFILKNRPMIVCFGNK